MEDLPSLDRGPALFQSFFMGGFECGTHRRQDRQRVDVIAATAHDQYAREDYALLFGAGVRTIRDGLRWHLIEKSAGSYDWTSFYQQLDAAKHTSVQVIWDLCHWGVPKDIDLLSEAFAVRFAQFARAAAVLIRDYHRRHGIDFPRVYCPINEVSFWSWVGGDVGAFDPFFEARGPELKGSLVRASLMAIKAIRSVDAEARFIQAEPIIHISAKAETEVTQTAVHTASQFEAWDMLAGWHEPQLGGGEEMLDLIGVNYYWNNQWIHEGDRTPPGHRQHRPLHVMLEQIWQRYRRPIVVTETGAEEGAGIGWLGYVSAEVRQAIRLGVPLLGICLYPVMDYPGWDDERHCHCGLIEASADWSKRWLRPGMCEEMMAQQRLFKELK